MALYNLFLFCYPKIAKLLGLFNLKASQWSIGQSAVWKEIYKKKAGITKPVIWVHCASYGEFEQGLPIIEALKLQYPNYQIWLTFFSPSGYLHRKDDPSVDAVTYLPFDGAKNAAQFIETIQPKLIVFIKYEFWYYYLKIAHQKQIPVLLAAAIFREDQLFFKWYGGLYRKMLNWFTYILVQDPISYELIKNKVDPNKLYLTGDTRFDRVITTANNEVTNNWISVFNNTPIIIAGSTWPSDHAILQKVISTKINANWIIVPHHVDASAINACKAIFENSITLTELEKSIASNSKTIPFTTPSIVIIDRIGLLRNLYQYATITYIGGGYTKDGIHNTLEPAAFGVPVIWGPNDSKYREAIGLKNAKGGFQINNANELTSTITELLFDNAKKEKMGNAALKYINENAGGTQKTIELIQEKRLLTN